MLTFLLVASVLIVLVSAGITLVACMASARMSQGEVWSEAPLTAMETAPQASRATRFSS